MFQIKSDLLLSHQNEADSALPDGAHVAGEGGHQQHRGQGEGRHAHLRHQGTSDQNCLEHFTTSNWGEEVNILDYHRSFKTLC